MKVNAACDTRIGTSGWHYKHWRGPFCNFISTILIPVEINNSFYRLPLASTFENWRRLAPPDCCFAVKASRYLAHMKKLKDPTSALQRFFPLVELLGEKLGPILFQLPPHWNCDTGRLAEFLGALPDGYRYSFELRDSSWHVPQVYEI